MRISVNRTSLVTAASFVVWACASGAADNQPSIVPGSTTPVQTTIPSGTVGGAPSNGGVTSVGTIPGTTSTGGVVPIGGNIGNGGATVVAKGGTTSTAKGGAPATGGTTAAATTGCTHPTPVASWKSPTACPATQTVIDTLFNTWRTAYFKECASEGSAYIYKDDESGNVVAVSEGIGYGMLITAALGKSADFAKLAKFYQKRLDGNGLMNWKYTASGSDLNAVCNASSSGSNAGAATDADLDAALAYLIADKAGFASTYAADAKTLIGKIKAKATASCSPGTVIKVGDQWGDCGILNPSYFSPGHFRSFATATGDTSWNTMASAAYTLLAKYQGNFGGKVYDWANDSGSGVNNPNTGKSGNIYGYEACRTPWRIALDYGWYQTAEAKTFLTTMNTKVVVPAAGYPASAVTVDTERNSCFVGGYALTGTAVDQATTDAYVANWLNTFLAGDVGTGAYFKMTLKLLYLIAAAGKMPSGA